MGIFPINNEEGGGKYDSQSILLKKKEKVSVAEI